MPEGFSVKSMSRKQVMAIAILLVTLFLGWKIIVQSALLKIKAEEASKKELAQKEPVFKNILGAEEKISGYKPFFVVSGDKSRLIGELNSLAAQSSLTINTVTPEEETVPLPWGNFDKTNLRIDATGNYHAVGQFVSRVENLKSFAKIMRLEIAGAGPVDMYGASEMPIGGRPLQTLGTDVKKSLKISMTIGLFSPSYKDTSP